MALGDRLMDLALAPALNRFRAELGLPAARHVGRRWWHSPQRVIGLFPDWFAPPQPDWPAQAVLTGFPLYDQREVSQVPPDLEAFFAEAEDAGDPPGCLRAGFRQSAGQALLCGGGGRLPPAGKARTAPDPLPRAAPLEVARRGPPRRLRALQRRASPLRRARAPRRNRHCRPGPGRWLPQLVMPMTFDQPDNAVRLARLGVARILLPERFTGVRVARDLEVLLVSNGVARRANGIARRFKSADPVARTCDLIEEVARRGPVRLGGVGASAPQELT